MMAFLNRLKGLKMPRFFSKTLKITKFDQFNTCSNLAANNNIIK
mgnify:CR=1 FL=1